MFWYVMLYILLCIQKEKKLFENKFNTSLEITIYAIMMIKLCPD